MNIAQPQQDQSDPSSSDETLSRESFHTLKILDEVAKGKPIIQRALSKKLGIALGMTNNYLKRLANLGYIQISQAERKRLHYLLTPKGITEKSALTYRYIKRSYQFFNEVREQIGRSFHALEKAGIQTVILYKATVITEIAVLVLLDTRLQLIAIVDDEIAGKHFLGQKIEPIKVLGALKCDRILITSGEPVSKVAEHLKEYGISEESIWAIL